MIFTITTSEKPLFYAGFTYLYVVAIWVTQWGSKYLGDQGYSAIEILRNFYGSNMYINTAEEISGIPASWPGQPLDIGSSEVRSDRYRNSLMPLPTPILLFRKFP